MAALLSSSSAISVLLHELLCYWACSSLSLNPNCQLLLAADWIISTPMLLLDLLLLSGMHRSYMAATCAADAFMILTGLLGALSSRQTKWGW